MTCAIQLRSAHLKPYALPLRRAFTTSRGVFHHRHGFVLTLCDAQDRQGLGDAAPWPGFGSGQEAVMLELGALVEGALRAFQYDTLTQLSSQLDGTRWLPEVRHALELGCLDLLAQARGVSLAVLLHGERALAKVQSQQIDTEAADSRWLKLKIAAGTIEQDHLRIQQALAARSHARLRLDANGAYDLAMAIAAVKTLCSEGVTSLEQPLATNAPMTHWRELREHTQAASVELLADESITDAATLQRFIDADVLDGVVLKPMFVGGLLKAKALAEQARRAGLRVTITSALESAVGRAGAIALASGYTAVHGLDSVLAEDFAAWPIRQGELRVPSSPGLGVRAGAIAQPADITTTSDPYALPHPLESAALAKPQQLALITADARLSYRQLRDAVVQEATQLAARGITAQQIIALAGKQDHRWIIRFHALGWLGAAVAPMPPQTNAERQQWLKVVRPNVILGANGCDSLELAPNAAQTSTLQALVPPATAPTPEERFWPLDEVRLVLCTSGSSAAPRRVELTTAQLAFSAFGSAVRLGHQHNDRWLCCLPLHHIGGLAVLLRAAFYGITVLQQRGFDEAAVVRAIDEQKATLVSLVPAMLERILARRGLRRFPDSLRAILLGGAAATPDLLERCASIHAPVALTWGMTEAASQLATRDPAAPRAEDSDAEIDAQRAGAALPFVRISTQAGRLHARGPLVRGALLTGDRGSVEHGQVRVFGRADNIIISGGENIAPEAIEEALLAHPSVHEALVVAVPSPRWGERPVALIVANDTSDDTQLRQHCVARLQNYMVPDHFLRVQQLPRGAIGKPSRSLAQALALNELASALGQQSASAQTVDEHIGRAGSLEGAEVGESMNDPRASTPHPVLADQFESKGDRARTDTLDHQAGVDALVQAHRPLKVGLAVNHRHADAVLVDERVNVQPHRQEQLLESLVTKLKQAPEKQNPSAINLKESDCRAMNESHIDDPR